MVTLCYTTSVVLEVIKSTTCLLQWGGGACNNFLWRQQPVPSTMVFDHCKLLLILQLPTAVFHRHAPHHTTVICRCITSHLYIYTTWGVVTVILIELLNVVLFSLFAVIIASEPKSRIKLKRPTIQWLRSTETGNVSFDKGETGWQTKTGNTSKRVVYQRVMDDAPV